MDTFSSPQASIQSGILGTAGMSGTSTAQPRPMATQRQRLTEVTDSLELALARLEDRLIPVRTDGGLAVPTSPEEPESKLAVYQSALAAELTERNDTLARLVNRVERLTDSVDL